ncbi:MAG TPA: hypothetical protein VGN00_14065 [Puia sp.]
MSCYPEKHRAALMAVAEMILITDAAREKDPDWNNRDEEKHTGWMDMEVDRNNPTGFRLFAVVYDYASAHSGLGSRLCFESEGDVRYHFEKHLDKMRAMMVIEK